jgi:purine-nucleoside phosphorylase
MVPTAIDGHEGRIVLGDWAGTRVLVYSGRNHFYEGHNWDCVLAPIRLAAQLGIKRLILTNAAGGIRDDLVPGTLMAIAQHLDWAQPRPWESSRAGTERLYSPGLREALRAAAKECDIGLRSGTYAAVLGPNYETPAEIRALRSLGADAVGMSTAREILAGFELGLECAAVSCITNRAAGLSANRLSHAEVLEMSRRQAERVGDVLEGSILKVSSHSPEGLVSRRSVRSDSG